MSLDIGQMDWSTLLVWIALAVVLWFVIRAVFKLAVRVFTCGCAVIFLAALALVLWRLFAATP